MDKVMNLQYEFDEFSLTGIKEVNSSFASGTLKVLYTGKNRNKSYIPRTAVERALPSLYNVPIVCNWEREEGMIGGHDIEVEVSENGMRIINLTEPCGVVPEHASFKFEVEKEEDGQEHEYLVIDGVLLWKRQDVYNHIVNDLDGKVKHSMEISIKDGGMNKETGYYEINDFEFTALCLLESCEPCFEGSELSLFSLNKDFKEKMSEMMSDLKEMYSNNLNLGDENEDTHPHENMMKGGETKLEDKMELAASYGIDIESLDFSIEDFSVEELTEKFEEMKNTVAGNEEVEETAYEHVEATEEAVEAEQNFELDRNIHEELNRALSEEKIAKYGEQYDRYHMLDHDGDKMEIYCMDANDWLIYSLHYSLDGDIVKIDFESRKRMKYAFVEFDNGSEQNSPFENELMVVEALYNKSVEVSESYNELSEKYSTMERDMVALNEELESLREFKLNTEIAQEKSKRDELFASFGDLDGIDAFEQLKENCMEYSVEDCEEKCYALRGKHNTLAKFSSTSASIKLPVHEDKETSTEPYGGVVEKYLKK